MAVKYGKFEMPEKISVDESLKKSNFSRFIIEAFERGFGHTIGHAMRRVLLTSIEAPAIVSFKIEGVPHEFTAVEGIIEDMTHIILNLKSALLRNLSLPEEEQSRGLRKLTKTLDISHEMIEKAGGQYSVTLSDLMDETHFKIVNPEQHIFTVTSPMQKRIDLKIAVGRGYMPSERHEIVDKVNDEIVLDSIFSPIRLVNYSVENTRVGQDTDFDRLILEIQTDGRISPQEALTFGSQILMQHFSIFEELHTHTLTFDQEEKETNRDRDELLAKLSLRINEIELSVRSTNCLASANIDTIGELVVMPESEMLRFRNFGKKSLTEIKEKLDEMGLSLGMDLSRYGINRDNIQTIINQYLEEKSGSTES